MNQRIQELYTQALENKFDYGGGRGVKPGEYYSNYKTVLNAEKFAELIVRECCQYLENEAERLYNLSGTENDPTFQSNFEICAEKCYDNIQGLKEHFGVEE